jgi:glycosyltransferase involved in cell wall biosynthesis
MKRIGVAFPGDPTQPTTWSGTPYGVMRGLKEAGVEPVALNVEPPRILQQAAVAVISVAYLRPGPNLRAAVVRAREAARGSRPFTALQSWTAPTALRRAGHLDGIVQIGTGFKLPTKVPITTFEDMTVLQTKSHPYLGWDLLSQHTFDSRVARQHRAYEKAVACCLASPWAAESVIRDYGVPPEKVHVVGVGRNHDAPPETERDWSHPRFLFVGLDWPRKNGDGVLRAFARLRDELPTARLDVVGGHPPLDAPGVTGHGILRLDVPEQHDRLDRLFGEATCFVMPSYSEAFGIAYVEAAAAGVPSIGTNQGGSDYLIGDGGLIVDPADDEALLAAMRRLSDPATAARTGAAAKRRAELFTWPAVGRRLLRALERLPAEPLTTDTSPGGSAPDR